MEECDDVIHFLLGQTKVAQLLMVDVLRHFWSGPRANVACIIEYDNLPESLEDTVVHVWSGHGDVSEGRNSELAVFLGLLYDATEAQVYEFCAVGIK